MEDNDLDIDDKDDVTSGAPAAAGSKVKRGRSAAALRKSASTASTTSMDSIISRENDHAITYDWVRTIAYSFAGTTSHHVLDTRT